MSRVGRLLGWLETSSDALSPIVVKEVRQAVRGHELTYAFGACLLAGLVVAFFGAADALTGSGTAGGWTFGTLMGVLIFLGLAVVPLGAFNAMRSERVEQTLELITLTALSPRRIVIGKLLAQGVKLTMLFAAIAPFIAMSFLLGGIDFVTILLWLLLVFLGSLWASAACLFLSTLLQSRTLSVLVFGAAGLALLVLFGGRVVFFFASSGVVSASGAGSSGAGASFWLPLAIVTTSGLITMVNLVLLAEHRLSLSSANRVTPLRVGFLLQCLLIVAWTLSFIDDPPSARSRALTALQVIGGLHLALVATFAVTEGPADAGAARRRARPRPRWRRLLAMFDPGGGRGAIYVLVHMALLLTAAWMLGRDGYALRWFAAMCGYICFFSGVPTVALQILKPARATAVVMRIAVLLMLPVVMLVPDILYYLLWRPEVVDLSYSRRHLLNPARTLSNWPLVESRTWFAVPLAMGVTGLLAYLAIIMRPATTTAAAVEPVESGSAPGEPDRASPVH